MYRAVVPTLVIRTDSPAMVAVNCSLAGECSEGGFIALPISDAGEYYITIHPLKEGNVFSRKLSFYKKTLLPLEADLVEVCVWPDSVYEATFVISGDGDSAREKPTGQLLTAFAFLTSVKDGREEAMGFISAELSSRLTFEAVREYLGEFSSCRAPMSDSTGKTVGLVSEAWDGIFVARLYEFTYEDGFITNIEAK